MVLGSPGPTPAGASFSGLHAVSHPDVLHAARPGLNDSEPDKKHPHPSSNPAGEVLTPPGSISEVSNGGSAPYQNPQAAQLQDDQLSHLSAIAASRDRMSMGTNRLVENGGGLGVGSKRTADGQLKQLPGEASPVKGHSRNTSTMSAISTVSMASTTTSTIGDLSSDLKTRLSYAMLKVQNGWQSNSLDEVESMASQAASPTSSNSTIHRHHDASASPRVPQPSAQIQYGGMGDRPKSKSPPVQHKNQPGLAPPAPIRPSSAGPPPNKRRHSNARPPPRLDTAGCNTSAHGLSQASPLLTTHLRPQDRAVYSPHQNVREQDAIETLLFMSSPGNSANMKHAFSPTGSPGPSASTPGNAPTRHALPSGPRKAQPHQRPAQPEKKVGFVNSPLTSQPQSPMDMDSPYASPNRAGIMSRRRVNGASSHLRGALSLPSGLGTNSANSPRRAIDDAYVENMLERAAAESSDEDEIELPPRRPAETFA